MDIRLEHTEGLGRPAQIWVAGDLLTVCDGISLPDASCAPGPLEHVKFAYDTIEGFSWRQALSENPGRHKRLEPLRTWSYTGYGRILSIIPVIIDFGVVKMQDANWTTDESLAGHFVRIPIDRLEIVAAHESDWPEVTR